MNARAHRFLRRSNSSQSRTRACPRPIRAVLSTSGNSRRAKRVICFNELTTRRATIASTNPARAANRADSRATSGTEETFSEQLPKFSRFAADVERSDAAVPWP